MSYHKTEGLSEEELRKLYLTRMEDYIKTMLTRYKGMFSTAFFALLADSNKCHVL
jgi:hypothetical protein